jgi:hypothetical protein
MFERFMPVLVAGCVAAVGIAPAARAGIKVYEDGDKFIEIGGRIQFQYLYLTEKPADGPSESEDTVWFRRLRPYIAGSVTKNWNGKIQFDFGKSLDADEVAVKDAYMQHTGFKNHKLFIGNSKTPFSREFLASSKRQQTVERIFVGQHNFGNPDRQLGFRLDGHTDSKKFAYKLAVGGQFHDPDLDRMDFDTPVQDQSDWNQGPIYAGRLDYFPMGVIKYDQGDFSRDSVKVGFAAAAFGWSNDDDNNTYTGVDEDGRTVCTNSKKCDLDSASGWELSAGLRGRGFSVDLEYNEIDGELTAKNETATGGLYVNGETTIEKWQLEGGYMLPSIPLELVYKYDSFDADGFETEWTGNDFGINYFFNKHKAKVQFVYRLGSDVQGVKGDDSELFIMQWQFVF